VQNVTIASCKNPTFSSDGTNLLADQAPQPQACDHQGQTQCATGSGGAPQATSTAQSTTATTTRASTSATTTPGTKSSKGTTKTVAGSAAKSTGSGGSGSTGAATAVTVAAGGAPTGDQGATGTSGAQIQGAASPATGGGADLASAPTATPTTLAIKRGWTGTQTLILVIVLMFSLLVLGPPVAARYLDRAAE
jgi:hypothetical protein